MKVILKQDVKGVGRKYEVKEISDGYANNFLLPKKLAEYASPEVVKRYELLKKQQQEHEEVENKKAHEYLEVLKDVTVTIKKNTNDKGHLFEKLHASEIAPLIKEATGIVLGTDNISFKQPIKEVGIHEVVITFGKLSGVCKVEVVSV